MMITLKQHDTRAASSTYTQLYLACLYIRHCPYTLQHTHLPWSLDRQSGSKQQAIVATTAACMTYKLRADTGRFQRLTGCTEVSRV